MAKFDMDSPRTKLELKKLGDLMVWLQYLYISPEHSVKIQQHTVKMDANFNLIWVMERRQVGGSYVEDFEHSICANTLCYKDLLTITEELKSDSKTWENIKRVVVTSKT